MCRHPTISYGQTITALKNRQPAVDVATPFALALGRQRFHPVDHSDGAAEWSPLYHAGQLCAGRGATAGAQPSTPYLVAQPARRRGSDDPLRGKKINTTATVVEEAAQVTPYFERYLTAVPQYAPAFDVKLAENNTPLSADVERATAGKVIVVIRAEEKNT
jgi:hypothetical protein